MAAPRPAGGAALARVRLSGVAFLLVIAGLVGLTVLIYNKTFTSVVRVSLETDRIGNQLSPPADVKVRGLIVGEVREVSSTGGGATVELALDPSMTSLIPADVQAQIIPKTLFGEKFVNLVVPAGSTGVPIAAGAVIPQDRSTTSIETEEVLNNLLPLLQALEPDQLSTTLNALSTALRGRGEALGANAVRTRDYLAQLNPALPDLQANLVGLADFADTLDQTAPDLLATLDNLSFSSRSLVDQETELAAFLATTTGFSDSLETLLADNEQRLVALNAESVPVLQLYARNSPVFPCIAGGLALYDDIITDTFGGLQPGLRIKLELTQDGGGFLPGDEPQYLDDRLGCFGLEDPVAVRDFGASGGVAGDYDFRDGYRDGRPLRGEGEAVPASAESTGLDALLAPVLGVPAEQVSDLAEMLFAPMARGATVGLS